MDQKKPVTKFKTILKVYLIVAFVVAIVSTCISTYVFHRGRYEDKPLQLVLGLCSLIVLVCIVIWHRRSIRRYEEQNKDRE